MSEKLRDLPRKKMGALVFMVVLSQIIILAVLTGSLKKGFYCDEMYAYGTANSGGVLSPLVEDDEFKYLNKWFDAQRIRDFLVVDTDEIFRYDLINKALKPDGHPPLHFYLLHLFSSFTPGRFTMWTGLALNMAAFFVMMVYVYRLSLLLSRERLIALITVLFFGFTVGAVNIFSFIRMYCLLCAFTVPYAFYSLRMMRQAHDGSKTGKSMALSAVFGFLAVMTQYQAVIFAFLLTVFICGYFLLEKKIKLIFSYGFSMLGSVVLMVVAFPVIIRQLNEPQSPIDNSSMYPFSLQFRVSLNLIFSELFGINTSIYPTMFWFWLTWTVIFILIAFAIVYFLFRKDKWALELRERARAMTDKCRKYKPSVEIIETVILFCVVVLMIVIASGGLQIYYYLPFSDRYLFIIYPFTVILAVWTAGRVIRNKRILAFVCALFVFLSIRNGKMYYINRVSEVYTGFNEFTRGADVILVGLDNTVVLNYCAGLTEAEKCFVLTKNDFRKHLDELESIEDDGRHIILVVEASPAIAILEKESPENVLEGIKKLSFTEYVKEYGGVSTAYVYELR